MPDGCDETLLLPNYIAAWLHKVLELPEGCTFHSALERVLCAGEDSSSSESRLRPRLRAASLLCMGCPAWACTVPKNNSQAQRAQVCGPLGYELTYSKFMWHLTPGQQVALQPLGGVTAE